MTPADFAAAMKGHREDGDNERAHVHADEQLVALIRFLSPDYEEGLAHFEASEFWYA